MQFKHISKDEHSFAEFYSTLKRDHLESTFFNSEISLRIFLSMMISNCTGEQSFSKLKLIKNELRSTMLQERLNCLSIMSIVSDVLLNINFDDIINEFSRKNAQKRHM